MPSPTRLRKGQAMEQENEKLKQFVLSRMNKLFDEVLYNVEMSVRSDYQYSVLRKRILRSGNNALRDIIDEVDFYKLQKDETKKRKIETMKVE